MGMNESEGSADIVASIARLLLSGDINCIGKALRALPSLEGVSEFERVALEVFGRSLLGETGSDIPPLIRGFPGYLASVQCDSILQKLNSFIDVVGSNENFLRALNDAILEMLSWPKVLQSIQASCYLGIARIDMIQGSYDSAVSVLAKASQLSGDARLEMHSVLCKIRLGQLSDAEQQLRFLHKKKPALDQDPMFHLAMFELTSDLDSLNQCFDLQAKLIEMSDRKNCFEYILTLNPNLMLDIARMYMRTGSQSYSQAERAISMVLAVMPRHESSILLLSEIYRSQSRFYEAEGVLSSISNNSVNAAFDLARMLSEAHKYVKAAETLNQVAASCPTAVRENGFYWLVHAKCLVDDYRRMIPLLHEAQISVRTRQEDLVEIRMLLIKALIETNQLESAMASLVSFKSDFPMKSEYAQKAIATLLIRMNKLDMALIELDSIANIDVSVIELKLSIFRSQANRKMYLKCLRSATTAFESAFVGDKYLAIGEVDEALRCYSQIEDMTTKSHKMADALCLGHKYIDAVTALQPIIDTDEKALSRTVEICIGIEDFDKAISIVDPLKWRFIVVIINSAFETTGDSAWLQRGLSMLQSDLLNNSQEECSEILTIKGEWALKLCDWDSAGSLLNEALQHCISNSKAYFGLVQVAIHFCDPEGATRWANLIESTSECKEEAMRLISEKLSPMDLASLDDTLPLVLNDELVDTFLNDPQRRYLGVIGLCRLGRLSELKDETDIASQGMRIALRSKNVANELRQLYRKYPTSIDRDRIVFRLTHVLLFREEKVEEARKLLGELSLHANTTDEYIFYRSVIDQKPLVDSGGHSSVLTAFVNAYLGKSLKKFKTLLKAVFEHARGMSRMTVLEFFIIDQALNWLSEIRFLKHEWSKTIEVCKFWTDMCACNPTAWYRLGFAYLRMNRVEEAVNALEKADIEDTYTRRELVDAYEKFNQPINAIKLIQERPKDIANFQNIIRRLILKLHT